MNHLSPLTTPYVQLRRSPYNVYAKHLYASLLGYTLWSPEIEGTNGLEVKIEDVGFLQEGKFIRIFNVTFHTHHEDHVKFGVADGHEPLDIKTVQTGHSRTVAKLRVCNRGASCSGTRSIFGFLFSGTKI